jgi:hypothetical protein
VFKFVKLEEFPEILFVLKIFYILFYIEGELLRVGDDEVSQVSLECVYFPDRGNASWTWTDPTTNATMEDLPICSAKCKDDPPSRSDLKSNWTGLVFFKKFI